MREVLVVNASPLIFLGNARRLDLLQGLGARQILVPEPVFKEVTSGGHADVAAAALLQATWCERGEVKDIPPSVLEWDLGPGESSVIALALQTQGACAVLDDLNGRKCGLALGVEVLGTVGIVISSHRRGLIQDPRSVLLELRAAGMWLSDAVITRALRTAGIDA